MTRGIYSRIKYESLGTKKDFVPLKHQSQTLDVFQKNLSDPSIKGMLLYHKLGSGKTCTSILIADTLLSEKLIDRVFVLTPGSLRQNWITEYGDLCGHSSSRLKKKYVFISYNYNIRDGLKAKDEDGKELWSFNNSLIIIDEAHIFINGVKNKSKNITVIYKKIVSSNAKVLLLTGTPIMTDIKDFKIFGSLLKPTLFEDVDDIETGLTRTMERRLFENIISYFPGSGGEYYPEVVYMPVIKTLMNDDQYKHFKKAMDSEDTFININSEDMENTARKLEMSVEQLRLLKIISSKRIKSRSISNAWYPKYKDFKDIIKGEDLDGEDNNGWLSCEILQNKALLNISTKITSLILNIILHPKQKHVVFSFYKTKSGLYLIHALLKLAGIKTRLFTGDLDDSSRKYILNKFNSTKNRYGKHCQVLLCSDAGAQGISLLETRHVHILESSVKELMIQQAIGRAVRYKSHWEMPKEEQNVKIWRYWSYTNHQMSEKHKQKQFPDRGKLKDTVICIDEYLYEKSKISLMKINEFLIKLQKYNVIDIEFEEKEDNILNNIQGIPSKK